MKSAIKYAVPALVALVLASGPAMARDGQGGQSGRGNEQAQSNREYPRNYHGNAGSQDRGRFESPHGNRSGNRHDRAYSDRPQSSQNRSGPRPVNRNQAGDHGRQGTQYAHRDDRRYSPVGPSQRNVQYHSSNSRQGSSHWVSQGSRHAWSPGDRLRTHYRGPIYVVNDYYDYGLRRPPSNHYWVRDDYGDFLMVAIATGIIVDLVLHH